MHSSIRLLPAALLLAMAAMPAEPPVAKHTARASGRAAPAPVKASATVRRWMKTMTLRDEVAQLVFIAFHGESPNSRSREYAKFIHLIRDVKVGGLILTNVANGHVIQ